MLRLNRLGLLAACLLIAACATHRPLAPFERPLARAGTQTVRTTAYTDTESDHRPYGCHNALGSSLCTGPVNSAAADWSRWPAGTTFRIRETGELYQVDDYGWALSGTNTIDLYKPSRAAMNAWGVHRVNIDVLQWGDVWHSYQVLKPRDKYAHVRRMLKQIEDRYPRDPSRIDSPVASPQPAMQVASVAPASQFPQGPPPLPARPANVAAPAVPRAVPVVARAVPVQGSAPGPVASNPFFR